MFDRRIFVLLLMTLWIAEPFGGLTTIQKHVPRVKNNVWDDDSFCCAYGKTMCGHLSGFFPTGCTPVSGHPLYFSQSTPKFMPSFQSSLFRIDLKRPVVVGFIITPHHTPEIFTPPPKLDHFA